MIDFTAKGDAVIFSVRVVPRAARSEIVGEHDGALKIRIAAPPVEGAANAELIKLLAKVLAVAKSQIEIVGGQASKSKQVRIENLEAAKLKEILR